MCIIYAKELAVERNVTTYNDEHGLRVAHIQVPRLPRGLNVSLTGKIAVNKVLGIIPI